MKSVVISKWGNSLGVRLPEMFVNALGLLAGDSVDMSMRNNEIVIQKKQSLSCREYLEQYYQKPYEDIVQMDIQDEEYLDWGADVGEEVIL